MRRSIKKVAAGLLATMMIGTMLTGCGGGNKKDSGSSKKETSEINIGFSQVGAESDWRVANTKSMKSELTAKNCSAETGKSDKSGQRIYHTGC